MSDAERAAWAEFGRAMDEGGNPIAIFKAREIGGPTERDLAIATAYADGWEDHEIARGSGAAAIVTGFALGLAVAAVIAISWATA